MERSESVTTIITLSVTYLISKIPKEVERVKRLQSKTHYVDNLPTMNRHRQLRTSTISPHLVRLYCHLAISRSTLALEVRNRQKSGTSDSQVEKSTLGLSTDRAVPGNPAKMDSTL